MVKSFLSVDSELITLSSFWGPPQIIPHLKKLKLEDLYLSLLMEREYDGLRGRGKDEGRFLKYDVQVEETLKIK